jgi:Skp family chaperone for outer membrane proteins
LIKIEYNKEAILKRFIPISIILIVVASISVSFAQLKVREYQTLAQEIESQSLLLSEEKKKEKLRELQDKATEIDKFKFEKLNPEGGEFYRKNQELFKPIIDKINNVINKVGTDEEYDIILDASSGALLHALPKYDLTSRILDELNKGVTVSP